jgi:fatty-acyl-CoA synthase
MFDDQVVNVGMGQTILKSAELSPNNPALRFEGKVYTYAALSMRIRKIATTFLDLGVSRGDRVGYMGLNHPCFLETVYACSCIGAIFVPLNFRLTPAEAKFIIDDAGIKVMFVDDACKTIIDEQKENLSCQHYISIESHSSDWDLLNDLLDPILPIDTVASIEPDDVALIMYTSGTTGLPKGAMLTHGNIFWNTMNVSLLEETMVGASLTCAPLFHIGGLNVTTHISLVRGVEVVLHRTFDAGNVLRDIEQFKVSTMFGAPTMFTMMSQHESFETTDFSSVISFNVGSAPVPVPLLNLYASRGVTFCQGYGLTETSPYVTVLSSKFATQKIGSAGQNLMFTTVRIVDGQGQSLANGERGEICVKGPNVMKGYWNRPEATDEAIDKNGWFHTGDVGYFDEDNFLFICDRIKDMVISGGENIYPAEVESVLFEHDAIAEVAVIGSPDEKWGELLVAVIVLQPGMNIGLEQLHSFVGKKLARYKLPRKLHIVDALPRNPAGKVQKFILKEQFNRLD